MAVITRLCLSPCPSVCWSVHLSICHTLFFAYKRILKVDKFVFEHFTSTRMTDRQTNGLTDGVTYVVACTQLMEIGFVFRCTFSACCQPRLQFVLSFCLTWLPLAASFSPFHLSSSELLPNQQVRTKSTVDQESRVQMRIASFSPFHQSSLVLSPK